MNVHLVDGTYELFRHFFALPPARDAQGRQIAAVRGVLASLRSMVREGATHIGVATDHVIESFRNALWDGYKTGEGIDPNLWSQFPLLEEALVEGRFRRVADEGVRSRRWPAAAAALAAADPRGRTRHHLHAGQRPGPVRDGHAHRCN